MFSGALLVGFVIVLTWCVEPLVFGVKSAGLLEDPTISVGMVSRLPGGAMDLTRAIEYTVQDGRTQRTSFEWLFPLTGSRASESGIDCRIIGVIAVVATLLSVTTWSAVGIFGIQSARIP